MRYLKSVAVAAIAIASAGIVASKSFAEPKEAPNAPAAGVVEGTQSPLRVGTAPSMTLMHKTYETTFAEMQNVLPVIEQLIKTVNENHVNADGYIVFIYKGVQPDKTKPFMLTIGIPVPKGTAPAGEFEVAELPPFKNASTLYNGGLPGIEGVYTKHYGELIRAGHVPTDEARELYLYWEGEQSSNNVVWIQAGIQ